MVFSVGKILWCIFEECSHTRNSTDENYEKAVPLEFPHFSGKTPPGIRTLIRSCTHGAEEWEDRERARLVRDGPRLAVSSARPGSVDDDQEPSPRETMRAVRELWRREVQRMEKYADAKARWVNNACIDGDVDLLGFPQRPLQEEVLAALHREADNRTL